MAYITFCQMTQNRLSETRKCVERYLPYVDKVVIVDGGSVDDTIFYMRNWANKEPKLEFYLYPWQDNFSMQRNNYLRHVPNNSWCLVSDPDEWFEENTLCNLQNIVTNAENTSKNLIGFQCRSVSYHGPYRTWENLDQYWKGLCFYKTNNTKYTGNPHEHLTGIPYILYPSSYKYEHVKQENVIWHRGARNLFCGGGGPNLGNRNQRWIDLRNICTKLGIHTWHQYDAYLIKGNIDPQIKQWMHDVKNLDGFDGASEHREMYKLYFEVYHPEEL